MSISISERAKKLILVSAISTLVTEDSKEAILVSAKGLEQLTCIMYSIAFQDFLTQDGLALNLVSALFDSNSEINTMHLAFAKRLGLVMQSTNVGV